jgi:hypothetical protein
MKRFTFVAVVFLSLACACSADQIQIGVIHPSSFSTPASFVPGSGIGLQSFIVANLGSTPFSLSDLVFSSSLLSTNSVVTPLVGANIGGPDAVINPGQAFGNINSDFFQQPTLEYVQSIFPSISSVFVDGSSRIAAGFGNPLNSGAVLGDSMTVVSYQLSVAGASAQWTTNYRIGVPELPIGTTAGTLGFVVSSVDMVPPVQAVPEPSTISLLASGLLLAGIVLRNRLEKRRRLFRETFPEL